MSQVTVRDLRQRVASLVGDPRMEAWKPEQLLAMVYMGMRAALDDVLATDPAAVHRTKTYTVQKNDAKVVFFDLPDDYYKAIGFEVVEASGESRRIDAVPFQQIHRFDYADDGRSCERVTFFGRKVGFVSPDGYVVRMHYVPSINEAADDDDEVELPHYAHDLAVLYAARFCTIADSSDDSKLRSSIVEAKLRVARSASSAVVSFERDAE